MASQYYTLESLQAGNSVGYLVKRCGILMMQIAERRFESQSITFTQWIVLAQLCEHPFLTPTELSHHLGHDMGALTRIVDDLLKKQLVRRERSEEDRRAVRITVTPEGRRLAKTAKSLVLKLANDVVEPYSKEQVDSLISVLQHMLVHMESVAEETERAATAGARRANARRGK
jgi:DNA-binding MarR family transcriptional regulator